ncbi:hypothetical protein GCM10022232_90090 [Streptomyces plumbiresistens]|uniref:Uncharacterized protein n=1 Tax=Streptomyces plumbiresistens TaxID=511811 RepID=A0ABP7TRH4_9ACTN
MGTESLRNEAVERVPAEGGLSLGGPAYGPAASPGHRRTGGVQTPAAERLQAGGVVYGSPGDRGLDVAGMRSTAPSPA